jgi:hypothetical protein
MQPKSSILSPVVVILTALVILGLFFLSGIRPALAQKLSGQNPEPNQATDTAAPTLADTPSNTTEPTFAPSPTIVTQAPPAPTVTQQPTPTEITQATTTYERPLIVVESYSTDADTISPGDQFELSVKVANKGQGTAHNIVAVFTPAELTPLGTGGVKAIGRIAPGNHGHFTQEFTLSYDAYGKAFTSIDMTITYTSDDGTSYSDKFTITVPVYTPSGVYATATPTMTPTSPPILRLSSSSAVLLPIRPSYNQASSLN